MNSKKVDVIRIVIYYILALLPLCVLTPILNGIYGEAVFVSEKAAMAAYVLSVVAMFSPAVAQVLTRFFTKEGFRDTYLALNTKGNMKYYIASVAVKLAEGFACLFVMWLLFLRDMSFGEAFGREDMGQGFAVFFMQLAISVIVFFPAFGEEFGWRGYLMPKLIRLVGKPRAIIAGGILWGLWHAPLTVSGHNFGVDYPLYPWLGILLMCATAIPMNAFLTLLTERTKSVYPASFCHAVHNNLSFMILLGIFGTEASAERIAGQSDIVLFGVYFPFLAVTGIVSFCLLTRREKGDADGEAAVNL